MIEHDRIGILNPPRQFILRERVHRDDVRNVAEDPALVVERFSDEIGYDDFGALAHDEWAERSTFLRVHASQHAAMVGSSRCDGPARAKRAERAWNNRPSCKNWNGLPRFTLRCAAATRRGRRSAPSLPAISRTRMSRVIALR